MYSGREGGVYSGRVAHIHMLKRGVYSERERYILGGSHIAVEKGGIFREGEVYSWRVAHNIHLLKGGII